MDLVDLHTHSTASDGSLTPTELVEAAHRAGLRALALTDHDSVGGLEEAGAAAARLGIGFLGGVELSVSHAGGSVHMLGYGVDPADPAFSARLADMQERRERRNRLMLERFAALGIPMTEADLVAAAGGALPLANVGRPHFARLLIERGAVASFEEAFDRFLAKGKPAYVPKERVSPEEGIEAVHAGFGLAVLAHPIYAGTEGRQDLDRLVERLAAAGLDGLECFYSDHSDADTAHFLALAGRLGLLVTGGSDFHGPAARPDIRLGTGRGGLRVPYAHFERLRDELARRKRG